MNTTDLPRLEDIPAEFPYLRRFLSDFYAAHPEEALTADGATRALEAVLRVAAEIESRE